MASQTFQFNLEIWIEFSNSQLYCFPTSMIIQVQIILYVNPCELELERIHACLGFLWTKNIHHCISLSHLCTHQQDNGYRKIFMHMQFCFVFLDWDNYERHHKVLGKIHEFFLEIDKEFEYRSWRKNYLLDNFLAQAVFKSMSNSESD